MPTFKRLAVASIGLTLLSGLVGCASRNPPSTWAKVEAPLVKDQTDDIKVDNGRLVDGTYWATIAPVSGSHSIAFRILKARFGATCLTWAKDYGTDDSCVNDYNVESYPEAYAALDRMADVSVAKADMPGTSFSVNAKTLQKLLDGTPAGAPSGYTWTPFPFLVTVTNGWVTTARQYWVP